MTKYFFFGKIFKQCGDCGGEKPQKERRVTRSKTFILEGGSKEEHDEETERMIKLEERVKPDMVPEKVQDIITDIFGESDK